MSKKYTGVKKTLWCFSKKRLWQRSCDEQKRSWCRKSLRSSDLVYKTSKFFVHSPHTVFIVGHLCDYSCVQPHQVAVLVLGDHTCTNIQTLQGGVVIKGHMVSWQQTLSFIELHFVFECVVRCTQTKGGAISATFDHVLVSFSSIIKSMPCINIKMRTRSVTDGGDSDQDASVPRLCAFLSQNVHPDSDLVLFYVCLGLGQGPRGNLWHKHCWRWTRSTCRNNKQKIFSNSKFC